MKTHSATLLPTLRHKMGAYWRAATYLSVGQIDYDNALLSQPLKLAHIKRRLFSHWSTTPGLNLVHGFVRIADRFSGPMASGPSCPL